jgi:predicted SAM-dependent methyltransferase
MFQRFLKSLAPLPVWAALRMEFYLFRIRMGRSRLQQEYSGAHEALVNFGAGSSGLEGWINVDAYRCPGVNFVWDCRYPVPLPDACARGVFSEHFLEHLEYETEVRDFLRECHRIMRPGAVIRIVVPDAGAYIRAYSAPDWQDLIRLRQLRDGRTDPAYAIIYQTKMQLINVLYRQFGEHKYAYDSETLTALLEEVGFSEAKVVAYKQSRLPELAIDLEVRASESLYVEAVR